MIEAASAGGLHSFAITEHISQIEQVRKSVPFSSTHTSGRLFQDLGEYVEEFAGIAKSGSPSVKKGLEVDYIQAYESSVADYVRSSKWDIILRSVHEFQNGDDIERKIKTLNQESAAKRWKEYINVQTQLVQDSQVPFDVLTHPVRLAVGTPTFPTNLTEMLTELTQACKKERVAVELNGRDLTLYPHLVKLLAMACAESNCPISFGSDAHHPSEVGRGLKQATALVQEFKLSLIA
jgi:histidinol-phosphatase (PHP family)